MAKTLLDILDYAKDLVRNTAIEVYVGIVIGTSAFGAGSWHHEAARTRTIPLGFSEISQIEREAELQGGKVGPMTEFLAKLNDTSMKVFECWNEAYRGVFGENRRKLASELEMRMDPTFKVHHYELFNLLPALPDIVKRARAELGDFADVRERTAIINDYFDKAWYDSHIDNYRPQTYTATETTTIGGKTVTRTVIRTRMVYFNTTHTYRYDREAGELASRHLDELIQAHPELKFEEKIRTASKTNPEGEYAAEKSMPERQKQGRLTPQELLDIANKWNTGSTLNANLPTIYAEHSHLLSDADKWRVAKATARSDRYNTGSHFDSGPREFQVAEISHEHGVRLHDSIYEIIEGMEYVKNNAPVLYGKILQFIDVVLNHKEGKPKKLERQIMEIAKEMYTSNFRKGFEVERFRWYMVAIFGFMGAVVGAGVGYGIDRLGNRN